MMVIRGPAAPCRLGSQHQVRSPLTTLHPLGIVINHTLGHEKLLDTAN